MIWKSYKCLTDEFSQVKQGEVFFVRDTVAQNDAGESLMIDTSFVKKEAKKKVNAKFELVGDKDIKTQPEAQEELPLDDDDGGKFIVVKDIDAVEGFGTLEKARHYAESLNSGRVAVAEVKGILKVEIIKKWEE